MYTRVYLAWNLQDQIILATFHWLSSSCVSDTQQTILILHWKMASVNSSKSHRFVDFLPSIRPSFLSVVLLFACGCLWVKNETTNERLITLIGNAHQHVSSGSCWYWLHHGKQWKNDSWAKRRFHEISFKENSERKEVQRYIRLGVRSLEYKKNFPYFFKLSLLLGEFHISHTSVCGARGNGFLAPSFWTEKWQNFVLAVTRAWKSVRSFMMCLSRNG